MMSFGTDSLYWSAVCIPCRVLSRTSLSVGRSKLVMAAVCLHVQAADIFFGSDAHPHDYLHEVLFRLVSVSWIGAAAQNLVNKVSAISAHPV